MERIYNTKTILEALDTWAEKQPDRIIYRFLPDGEGDQYDITYAQLRDRAREIAGYLKHWRGERALMLFHSGPDFLEAFLGCLYAGVIAVPAYPPRKNHGVERLRAIINDCAPQVILTTDKIRQFAEPVFAAVECTTGQGLHQEIHWVSAECIKSTDVAGPLPDPHQIAFLQYTSGSTGIPKGVMVSHENLTHNARLIHGALQSGPQHHVVSWLPLFHDMGLIGGALYPLFQGIDALLMPPAAFLQKPYRWLKAISDISAQGPVGTVAPNFAWQLCTDQITEAQRATLDLSRLQYALTGAEPVRASTLEAFATRFRDNGFQRNAFCPCYGLAEATLLVTAASNREPVIKNVSPAGLGRHRLEPPAGDEGTVLVSAGRPQIEKQIAIVDPVSGVELGGDAIGEIWVAGAHICQGYWNQPDASRATFNNYTRDGQGPFLRTGDLGAFTEGELFVTGRLKDLIIIRGRNIYPHDIEFIAEKSHKALQSGSSAAFTIEHGNEEKLVLVAEIDRSHRLHFDAEVVCASIRRAITQEFDISIHAITLLKPGALLKTSSGKVQRSANRQQFLDDGFAVLAQWQDLPLPVEHTEDLFADAGDFYLQTQESLQRLLKCWVAQHGHFATIEEVAVDVPFESHGIDSINAMRLVASLELWSGLSISIDALIENDTIEELTDCLLASDLMQAPSFADKHDTVEGTI